MINHERIMKKKPTLGLNQFEDKWGGMVNKEQVIEWLIQKKC